MEADPNCCVCGARDWESLGTREYKLAEAASLSDYIQKRYRVLFEVWFPGQEAVTLTSSVCRACGFVTNVPRVSSEDVDAKYRFIAELGQDYGKTEADEIERKRSERTLGYCASYLKPNSRVLDYGGGDGRLMHIFAEAGHKCFLIDYNESPRDCVTKLGDTVDGITDEKFDLIVCNHVIEHVPDPVGVVRQLKELTSPGGTIYIEVPLEIWRKPPLHEEPVTHVNFFVAESLRRVLEEAGVSVVRSDHTSFLHTSGRILPAVRAFGKVGSEPATKSANGFKTVGGLLRPGFAERAARMWAMRETLPKQVSYKIKRLLGR